MVRLFRGEWREWVMDFIVMLFSRKQKLTRCLASRYVFCIHRTEHLWVVINYISAGRMTQLRCGMCQAAKSDSATLPEPWSTRWEPGARRLPYVHYIYLTGDSSSLSLGQMIRWQLLSTRLHWCIMFCHKIGTHLANYAMSGAWRPHASASSTDLVHCVFRK